MRKIVRLFALHAGVHLFSPLRIAITATAAWAAYSIGLTILSIVLDSIHSNPVGPVSLALCFFAPLPDAYAMGRRTWRGLGTLFAAIHDWQLRNLD